MESHWHPPEWTHPKNSSTVSQFPRWSRMAHLRKSAFSNTTLHGHPRQLHFPDFSRQARMWTTMSLKEISTQREAVKVSMASGFSVVAP